MTSAERIQLQRAEEQVAALGPWRRYEREPNQWRITGPGSAPLQPKPHPCLQGYCSRRVIAFGYCRVHLGQVRSGVALHLDLYDGIGERKSPRGGATP